ncbi:MAG: alpha-2-macroglobulin [Prevotella sp.]|nr:alpha-2-macroglobulin [Prevotella sp.]
MKRIVKILLLITLFMPMKLFGQTYSTLWKQVETAQKKDKPRSVMAELDKIRNKAEKEKEYGHLLKAELLYIRTETSITPDSLQPSVERLVAKEAKIRKKSPAFAAVYQTVLSRIYNRYSTLGSDHYKISREYKELAMQNPALLAATKATEYEPLLIEGYDSRWFDNDLLSVIGYELDEYQKMHDYYVKTPLRTAACLTALEMANEHRWWGKREVKDSKYIHELDSLISEYGDLTVAGEIAISKYEFMERATDVTVADRVDYINNAINKWGDWPRMNQLRNDLKDLTQPEFNVDFGMSVMRPGMERKVVIENLRHIGQLTMTVTQLNLDASKDYNVYEKDTYAILKKAKMAGTERVVRKKYNGMPDYHIVEKDSVTIEPLPIGVYLAEFTTDNSSVEPMRFMFYVTDLYVMQQELPGDKLRIVVVNATTGQPVPNANLRFLPGRWASDKTVTEAKCNAKGEYVTNYNNNNFEIFAYTAQDKALPTVGANGNYSYYPESQSTRYIHHVYTDRSIYRPGQTVHVAVVAMKNKGGLETEASARELINVTLRNANWKEIAAETLTADEFGTAYVDFTLPNDGLNGRYSIRTDNGSCSFRVEEYKRPTFQVEFPKVEQLYHIGDTVVVSGHARTYAGVPVQGANVKYTITRRQSWWWHRYGGSSDYGTQLAEGTAVTDADGAFRVEIPIEVSESEINSRYPQFYNITTVAEVTDQAGETRTGELVLPIGTRETAFSCDIPDKFEQDSLKNITFALNNAAGVPVKGTVSYQFDDGKVMKTEANKEVTLPKFTSGKHHLHAVCGKETFDRDFVVFSLSDKRPCIETHDWYYLTDNTFPRDGGAVHQQLGTSDDHVHVIYTIISGNNLLESGSFELNNENQNRDFKYKEEWGSGIILNYAWVRDGILYKHSQTIARPLPEKRLKLEWTTFRDRLTPGQEETWTLRVTNLDGTPAKAQMLAVLYDQSLDQIVKHHWSFDPQLRQSLPSNSWAGMSFSSMSSKSVEPYKRLSVKDIKLYHFDSDLFDFFSGPVFYHMNAAGGAVRLKSAMVEDMAVAEESTDYMMATRAEKAERPAKEEDRSDTAKSDGVQLRENLNETAFFYPALLASDNGDVTVKFTLPESITTWQFMGMAHDKQMNYGFLNGESVAKKDVMVQPNMPRFVRAGDQAQITTKIFNTSDKDLTGTAKMELLDPENEAVVFTQSQQYSVAAGQTATITYPYQPDGEHPLLICRMTAKGDGYSDGEQHYLPVLPDREQVLNTRVITQHHPGIKEIDINQLFPAGTSDRSLTVEYTNNPAWMMIQALPTLAVDDNENAISQAAAFYANAIGQYLMNQSPKIKETVEAWNLEQGDQTSLNSNLEKNQELKNIVLNETPWVMDGDFETNQRRQLADFFNEEKINNRLAAAVDKLKSLQNGEGAWSWWKGMMSSPYITTEVTEMLVRLNTMTETREETARMLERSFKYLGKELVEEMEEMKKAAKKGAKDVRPSEWAVQTLYTFALDGRELPANVAQARQYMVNILAKRTTELTIYGKSVVAVILAKNGKGKKAEDYLESIWEYSVMTEEMGRYYDTPKAYYSWFDYKIPSQVAAVEAIQLLRPSDEQTIEEMQRWLLMSKRTQAWDTPINSVNAVYVFMKGNNKLLDDREPATIMADGRQLTVEARNAGLGSEKHRLTEGEIPAKITVDKPSTGTSWGAVYAQFTQKTTEISDASTGMSVKREIIGKAPFKVGDRVKIRLTIEATQDFDFVQVIDKRAACLEPVSQLSGYHYGYYCSPKDQVTNYYFDRMPKGKHVIETEYYIDREGSYTTGSCTVQCAYAPEYSARAHAETIQVIK